MSNIAAKLMFERAVALRPKGKTIVFISDDDGAQQYGYYDFPVSLPCKVLENGVAVHFHEPEE
jgi:hypothetical protein